MNESYEMGLRLWADWTEMWSGRTELARQLVAARFRLHLPLPNSVDPATITDPASVERWVTAHRARFGRLRFHYDRGPFVDSVAGIVAGPWWADSVLDGKARLVCGMDTIAFSEGKISEYWTLAKEAETAASWMSASKSRP